MQVANVLPPKGVKCPHEIRPDDGPHNLEEARGKTIGARALSGGKALMTAHTYPLVM
jgi:hypothetical protein